MRLKHLAMSVLLVAFAAPAVRAEYIVLRSGQRMAVTGYQILGNSYRLQLKGGTVDVPVEQVLTIEPEEIFTPVPRVEVSQEPFGELIRAAAKRYSVDADLITSVIAAESNFDPKAISRRNARGLMQLLPTTAAHLGVKNIFDPQENIDAGTHYLSDLLLLYKNDLALTLAAYNAGPQRVAEARRRRSRRRQPRNPGSSRVPFNWFAIQAHSYCGGGVTGGSGGVGRGISSGGFCGLFC